jgi:ferritin-like metal-binding protein YciE
MGPTEGGSVFERLNTPQEAYNFKLGAALKMERETLKILDDTIENAQDGGVRDLFARHREETEGQIDTLERVFGSFGWDVDDSPCPAIEGIRSEGKANAKKTDDALVDSVLLQGAVETEHHEIAVYENLIINARAMGNDEAVRLLQGNLEIEQQTLDAAKRAQEQVAQVTPKAA